MKKMNKNAETVAGSGDVFEISAGRVTKLVRGEAAGSPPQNLPNDLAVYVVLRKQGRRISHAWTSAARSQDPLAAAIASAQKDGAAVSDADVVEVCFAHSFRPVEQKRIKSTFSNLNRGRIGIQLTCGDRTTRYAPTRMIATNRSFVKIIETFTNNHQKKPDGRNRSVMVRRFDAESFLVPLDKDAAPQRLFRGNQVVSQEDVTAASITDLARRMSDWMLLNLKKNGRMTYKYWPSRGKESDANNMIRQWMASVALVRIAAHYDDTEARTCALKNIRYNLTNFSKRKGDLEFIYHQDESKLGATALAALALREYAGDTALEQIEARMRNTVKHLWNDDGSFTTFLIPKGENRNQNFYPGEALVYLAACCAQSEDNEAVEKIMKSVSYYRRWHLENRNPAFVPWHVMAYETVWHKTGDDALRDWIFEMSDWLTGLQVADSNTWPDINGRFYDPARRQFGRPHASATGVYLEGMIAAWRVARASGDTLRQEAYRVSIVRGLRSLLQLEFSDEIDMFYISKRERVAGGLRTTVYDNEVRVDNVQHGLMAILQVLRDFSPEDFRPPSG